MVLKFIHTILEKFPAQKGKLWARNLIVYTFTLVFCVVALSLGLTFSLRSNLEQLIEKNSFDMLEQIGTLSDNNILVQTNTLLNQNFLNLSADNDLNNFFQMTHANNPNIASLMRLYHKLNELQTYYVFLDSIAIYNYKADITISSSSGLNFATNNHDKPTFRSGVNSKLPAILSLPKYGKLWITPKENEAYYPDASIATFVSAIPITSYNQDEIKGCVLFNINTKNMLKRIDSFFPEDMKFMIIDTNNRLIASNDYAHYSESPAWLQSTVKKGGSGVVSHEDIRAVYSSSSISDWVYIAMFNSRQFYGDVWRVTQLSLWITFAILLISFPLLYFATNFAYKPLNRLITLASKKVSPANAPTNWDIEEIVESLSVRITDLETVIDDNKSLIRNQIIWDILNGNIFDINELLARCDAVSLEFSQASYALVFTEADERLLERLNYMQIEALYYRMMDQMRDAYQSHGIVCHSVKQNNYIVSILSSDTTIKTEDLYIISGYDGYLNIGFCQPTSNLLLLEKEFKKLTDYMKYRFIYGYGNLFTYDIIEAYETSAGTFGSRFLEDLEKKLKSGKIDDVKYMLDDAFDEIRRNGYSYRYTQGILLQVAAAICSTAREQGIMLEDGDKEKFIEELNHAKNMYEYQAWLQGILDTLQSWVLQRDVVTTKTLLDNISDYVDHNLDDKITLASVAEKFSVTPDHLSRVFKKNLNINFSTYLIEKKFERAAHTLRENSKASISEIAASLGYYNLPYFNQKFKEIYGVSPIQYKRSDMIRQDRLNPAGTKRQAGDKPPQ